MPETAELVTNWPAMTVHPVRLLREWLTADEIASGQLTFSDGTGIAFNSIDLPPTPVAVHRGAVLAMLFGRGEVATVAGCIAWGDEPEASIKIYLEAESVVMEMGKMIAKAVPATARIVLTNGDVWDSKDVPQPDGYGMFPDCPVNNGVAQPVEAKFVLAKI